MESIGRTFDIAAPKASQKAPPETNGESSENTPPDLTGQDEQLTKLLGAPYGPDSPHPDEEKRPYWWRSRWVLIGAPACAVFAMSACFIAYGTTYGLSKTYLGTVLVPRHTSSPVLASTLTSAQKSYAFKIAYPDKHSATYAMSDAGITIDTAATGISYHNKLKHSGFRRFVWWRPMHFTVATKVDQQKLNAFMQDHANSANVGAVDAQLNVTSGATSVTEAKDGSTYSMPGGKTYLMQNIERLKAATLTLVPQKLPAKITAKDLAGAKKKVDEYIAKSIAFTVADQTVQASKADIAGWLDISPVPSDHTADVTVNSGKVQAYINKLSAKYTKPAVSEIQTTDEAGNTSVLIAGVDGIDVVNKNDAAKAAANALQSPDKTTIDLAISHVAHTTVKAGDYDKWIVADITTKRMYAYEHTTLVHSFLISAGAPKTPTVTGQYKIYSKYVSKDMKGRNADGSRYSQPHVHYVNFFYQDYAIHGNYWRPTSYFGNINSSHGCIGITDSDAKWMYDWAPIGTTVITHA